MAQVRSKINPASAGQKSKTDTSDIDFNIPSTKKSPARANSMVELMAHYSKMPVLKKGSVVEGMVKKLTPAEITLDIGAKSDALVLEFDKQNMENLLKLLKIGEKVKAVVLSPESEEGFPVVSLRRTLDELIFSRLEALYKNNLALDVVALETTRGGLFAVTDEGVRGFLPTSQVLGDFNIVGKTVSVKIIDFDKEKKRVIFSQKAIKYITDPAKIQKFIERNQVVKATISSVTPHGLYVVILPKPDAFIEGFVHISEVSYQRIEQLQDWYKNQDVIEALVLEIDAENRRVNLSIKKLEKDSFEDIKQKYTKEMTIKGVVLDVKARGVMVEIAPSVFGFIPSAKVPTGISYQKGASIDAQVTDIDQKRRMVMLTPVLKEKPIGYR